jgi:hypothetical protein
MRRYTMIAGMSLALMLMVGSAWAGKPGPSSASAIAPAQTSMSLGSTVTFSVSYPQSVKYPRVQVLCYQNSGLVYGEAGTYDHAFVLGGASSKWVTNGGSASCEADLYYFSVKNGVEVYNQLAATRFKAAA